jgi:DNA ligase (NAD+)
MFIYSLGYYDEAITPLPRSHWDTMQLFAGLGLRINPENRRCKDLDEVIEYVRGIERRREHLDYEIDGVVIKIDSFDYQDELGSVGNAPRWATAFKFAPVQGITQLHEIRVNVGRTGALNPFALLEPVQVGGVTISQATLHNEDDIHRKDIREGDWVVVHRAGEVIPQVVAPIVSRRTGAEQPWHMPEKCPACGTPAGREEGEAMYRCPNLSCPAQFFRLLGHFTGVMEIDGFGEAMVGRVIQAGYVHDLADVYHLTKEQLVALEGVGDKMASMLLTNIEASKARPLGQLIFALGIRHVGEKVARDLAGSFPEMQRLMNASADEIAEVPGLVA